MRKWHKVLGAIALVIVLAGVAATVLKDVVVADICSTLDPDSWWYWLNRCGKDAAGGGTGGAG